MHNARKILVLLYALFYVWLAHGIEQGNVSVGYSTLYVLVSTLAQVLLVIGIVLSTFDDPSPYNRIWKALFPLLVLDLVVEIAMDAVVPDSFNLETHGGVWLLYLVVSLILVAPAYYFNYRVARS